MKRVLIGITVMSVEMRITGANRQELNKSKQTSIRHDVQVGNCSDELTVEMRDWRRHGRVCGEGTRQIIIS